MAHSLITEQQVPILFTALGKLLEHPGDMLTCFRTATGKLITKAARQNGDRLASVLYPNGTKVITWGIKKGAK